MLWIKCLFLLLALYEFIYEIPYEFFLNKYFKTILQPGATTRTRRRRCRPWRAGGRHVTTRWTAPAPCATRAPEILYIYIYIYIYI